jgi:hypothetical protein
LAGNHPRRQALAQLIRYLGQRGLQGFHIRKEFRGLPLRRQVPTPVLG